MLKRKGHPEEQEISLPADSPQGNNKRQKTDDTQPQEFKSEIVESNVLVTRGADIETQSISSSLVVAEKREENLVPSLNIDLDTSKEMLEQNNQLPATTLIESKQQFGAPWGSALQQTVTNITNLEALFSQRFQGDDTLLTLAIKYNLNDLSSTSFAKVITFFVETAGKLKKLVNLKNKYVPSPLRLAIEQEDIKKVATLLQLGADSGEGPEEGERTDLTKSSSLFMLASTKGNWPIMEMLLAYDAKQNHPHKIDLNEVNHNHDTPLMAFLTAAKMPLADKTYTYTQKLPETYRHALLELLRMPGIKVDSKFDILNEEESIFKGQSYKTLLMLAIQRNAGIEVIQQILLLKNGELHTDEWEVAKRFAHNYPWEEKPEFNYLQLLVVNNDLQKANLELSKRFLNTLGMYTKSNKYSGTINIEDDDNDDEEEGQKNDQDLGQVSSSKILPTANVQLLGTTLEEKTEINNNNGDVNSKPFTRLNASNYRLSVLIPNLTSDSNSSSSSSSSSNSSNSSSNFSPSSTSNSSLPS